MGVNPSTSVCSVEVHNINIPSIPKMNKTFHAERKEMEMEMKEIKRYSQVIPLENQVCGFPFTRNFGDQRELSAHWTYSSLAYFQSWKQDGSDESLAQVFYISYAAFGVFCGISTSGVYLIGDNALRMYFTNILAGAPSQMF